MQLTALSNEASTTVSLKFYLWIFIEIECSVWRNLYIPFYLLFVYKNLKRSKFWGFSFEDTTVFPKLGRKYRLMFLIEGTLLFQMSQTVTRSDLSFLFYGGTKHAEIFTLFEAESCLFFTQKLWSRFSRNFVFQKFNFKMLYLWEFCTLEARRGRNRSEILSSSRIRS